MTIRVLCDFHHQALYNSLYLLFEKRLGWELYRPIGEEWFHQGYWKVYNHPATVAQFLGLYQGRKEPLLDGEGVPWSEPELVNKSYTIQDGIYYVKDITHNITHRAITLDKFKEMKFNILISSIPQHVQPYNNLITNFQPQAKHIFQVGNNWGGVAGVNNIMASTAAFGSGLNTIFYHQEFDLSIFKYNPPTSHNIIHSYIHYMQQPNKIDQVMRFLPGWQSIKYGAGMDQSLESAIAVADAMKKSAFTWHFKPGGDGYGHVLFSTYACGRPAIIEKRHYAGCLGDALLLDGQTCICMDEMNPRILADTIKAYSEPEIHKEMCQAAYKRFKEVVDFDREFEEIKKFLEKLI